MYELGSTIERELVCLAGEGEGHSRGGISVHV